MLERTTRFVDILGALLLIVVIVFVLHDYRLRSTCSKYEQLTGKYTEWIGGCFVKNGDDRELLF